MERMMEMKRRPKNAPILVTAILLPYSIIRMTLNVITALIELAWDGVQALGPRFQGFVLGVWAGFALFMFAVSLAIFG